jgi:hypothetical protein
MRIHPVRTLRRLSEEKKPERRSAHSEEEGR